MSNGEATGKFVELNGMSMYYEEHGSGSPLVLLHGGFGSSVNWAAGMPSFSEHFRVITPDSRAHGRSDNPAGTLSYAQMADDVAALIETLELDKPFVGGWSDGGQIALELGMRYPDMPRGLIVAGAWYALTDQSLEALRGRGFEGPGQLNEEMFEHFLEEAGVAELFDSFHHHGPGYLNTLALQLTGPFMTNLDYQPEDFAKVSAPTLVLLGDRDAYIPVEQAVHMFRHIPNAELAIVPGTGHELNMAKPQVFADIALEFLIRHSLPPEG